MTEELEANIAIQRRCRGTHNQRPCRGNPAGHIWAIRFAETARDAAYRVIDAGSGQSVAEGDSWIEVLSNLPKG